MSRGMGKTFGNSVFTINIYGEGGREQFNSDGRQINLASWVVSTTYVLKNTQSRHFLFQNERLKWFTAKKEGGIKPKGPTLQQM